MSGEPPDSWSGWAELAGIAAMGFALGLVVSYVRAPRAHRKAVNGYVMERISDRTRTVLAVLKVSSGYWDDEIEMELECPGDIVQEATIISDRRLIQLPIEVDVRGKHKKIPPQRVSKDRHPSAY